ncbi:carboxymuconolactone decarboxylase family protein [Actinomadura kijaniata]|uniref:carboxymuconolactone decarboxylase family protein n=1 Tax=Actinomadura kijaniata TaxID=46161 RepID=UPI003F1C7348
MRSALVLAGRRGARTQIRHVSPPPSAAAGGLVARVYAQLERDFGMLAPPVTLHAPAPGLLAACWMMLRETLVAGGLADRADKEAVAAAVSRANSCPYCVDVHGATLSGLTGGDDATAADGPLADWAGRCGRTRPDGGPHTTPPFPAALLPELGGVVVVFHYLNRMVNVFLTDSPFPARVPAAMRPRLRRLAGRLMRPAARRSPAPAAALDLLPAAPLPGDLSWAAGSPHVAGALAAAAATIDDAGARDVPAPVREAVLAALGDWNGDPPGLSRGWADARISGVPAADRPAARLALLTALASYQVDDSVVADFRRDRPEEGRLVGLTSWAAMAAARRVARLLPPGSERAATSVERANTEKGMET